MRWLHYSIVWLGFTCNFAISAPKSPEALVLTTATSPVVGETFAPAAVAVTESETTTVASEKTTTAALKNVTDMPSKPLKPEIYSFRVHSQIQYRYSRTFVTSRVANPDPKNGHETTFRIVLPETAFISKFLMEIEGKVYEAYVKEKEEAKKVYNEAQSQGQSAGLVEVNSRHSNVFNVNVNIKPETKVTFNLTYEELLNRKLGQYEQFIQISPEQMENVKDFQILVTIEESQNITKLRVPKLSNDLDSQIDSEDNKDVVIERPAGNKANITWTPSVKDQTALAKQGVAGKFIVQYDIDRDSNAGEILVMEGYFVHFFAPKNLSALRKHVVFVLDISGSMFGRKMDQLKESQKKILDDLSPDDFFNIITFSSGVFSWSPIDEPKKNPDNHWAPPPFHGQGSDEAARKEEYKRQPFAATPTNIRLAKEYIDSLVASGGTNIHDAIMEALNLTSIIRETRKNKTVVEVENEVTTLMPSEETTVVPIQKSRAEISNEANKTILPKNVESLIMFLTDGEPTVGYTNPVQIQQLIQVANKNMSVPIFSLAFGDGADFPFVRKLSLQNHGFARKIYEASDAVLQLKGFYNEIASPLLSNVTFNYTSPEYNITDLTIAKFPTIFGGTEIVLAGRLVGTPTENDDNKDQLALDSEPSNIEETDQLVPTDRHYLDVSIIGSGRDGVVDFDAPSVFSSPIPWGIPLKPYPPRPTAPPSEEDKFLERLWAYLTIQQLIEKDLAAIEATNDVNVDDVTTTAPVSTTPVAVVNGTNQSSKNSTVKDTPKQQALKLALKYGFVTPLTSLVVVKPNVSDVADAVSTDAKPDVADSIGLSAVAAHKVSVPLIANLAMAHSNLKFAVGGLSTANRFGGSSGYQSASKLRPSLTQNNYAVNRPQNAPAGFPTGQVVFTTPASSWGGPHHTMLPSFGGPPNSFLQSSNSIPMAGVFEAEESTTVVVTTTTGASLQLQDIKWLDGKYSMRFNNTSYAIAQNDDETTDEGYKCNLINANATDAGECRHLKDCVKSTFVNDKPLFRKSYFCPLRAKHSGVRFVGTCCVR